MLFECHTLCVLRTNSGCYHSPGSNDRSCWLISATWSPRALGCNYNSYALNRLRRLQCCGMYFLHASLRPNKFQGAYTIKLAQKSNIHPLIVVAGKGTSYVETLITSSKGDTIVDYRNGHDAVVSGIQAALKKTGASEVKYAFDAVSEKGSFQNISKVLAKEGSKITLVLPGADYSEIPEWISHNTTTVGTVHQDQEKQGTTTITGKDFGYVYVFSLLLITQLT